MTARGFIILRMFSERFVSRIGEELAIVSTPNSLFFLLVRLTAIKLSAFCNMLKLQFGSNLKDHDCIPSDHFLLLLHMVCL